MSEKRNNGILISHVCEANLFSEALHQNLHTTVEQLKHGPNKYRSAIKYHFYKLQLAWNTYRKRNDVQCIIFFEQFVAFYYSMLCKLFFFSRKRPSALVLVFIYVPRSGLLGKLSAWGYNLFTRSKAINYFICHSSKEKHLYSQLFDKKGKNRFHFIRYGNWGTTFPPVLTPPENNICFFAGGGSNRDYETLIEAFRGEPYQLTLVCRPESLSGLNIPDNVNILCNIPNSAFDEHLKRSYAVIIPIKNEEVSAGQLVLLNAMRNGKASIVTKGPCMEDYTDSSYAISVSSGSVSEMRNAIRQLAQSPDLKDQMAKSARKHFESEYTGKALSDRVSEFIESHALI